MTTIFYIYISILASLAAAVYFVFRKRRDEDWIMYLGFTCASLFLLTLVFMPIVTEFRYYLDEPEMRHYELVSLVTNPQTTGNLSGGGSIFGAPISGSIGSESYASFAYKNDNGDIKVISVPCSQITFREADKPSAKLSLGLYWRKYAFRNKTKNTTYYSGENAWIIEVPKESIGRYIRVN